MPDTNYLLFLFCKFHAFTIPQAPLAPAPFTGGCLFVCADIAKNILPFPQGVGAGTRRLSKSFPTVRRGSRRGTRPYHNNSITAAESDRGSASASFSHLGRSLFSASHSGVNRAI